MTISKKIESMITKASWIRRMFEEGAKLKAAHGAKNVFDFSLGNPNLQPPECFYKTLKDIADSREPGMHGYMPNIGYLHVRKAVADYLSKDYGIAITADEIIMSCGAGGALNVILKTILDPGDEVLCPAPYFVEYTFYADNHGGELKTVPTKPDFTLDIDAIGAAITDKTKAIIINSPNNPTGQIYSEESLKQLGKLLEEKGKNYGRMIYLLSDQPYRKIVYNGAKVPCIFDCYRESIIATSYSKSISIPGERIGYIAINPQATHKSALTTGMTLATRILGFINAPALMQRVIAIIQGTSADLSAYTKKRDLLCNGLAECGYEFVKPAGAFYLFPRTPIPDDVKFVRALQEELILTVPGSGFGGPGHLRIAFCVDDETIINAMPGFERVMRKFR